MFISNAQAATLPLAATEIAKQWDVFFWFLVIVSLIFFVGVVGAFVYFSFKYKAKPGVVVSKVDGNHLLEIIWTVIPTILVLVVFAWGWVLYHKMINAPEDSYEVRVLAKQWMWQFQYPDGRVTTGEFYAPAGKPVKLIMTSEDVIHGFFIPEFRMKQDVVPGMFTSVWFEATAPGVHPVYCTQYCGTAHSGMLAKAIILDAEQWKKWNKGQKIEVPGLNDGTGAAGGTLSMADQGKKIMQTKGCIACHNIDGSKNIGPALKGIYGEKVEHTDGTTATVDDNYIKESIENPNAKVVKGFPAVMPTFKGSVNDAEINNLIAFIKSLK